MISFKTVAHQVERFTVDNSPVLLTAVGVAGTLSSVVLTAKATINAAKTVQSEKMRRFLEDPKYHNASDTGDIEISSADTVKMVWKEYLPAAGTLTVTVAAIVFANRISTRRAAAMAAAYSLSEKAYSEYREKVVDKFNANKERQVRDEIAQDRVNQSPPKETQIIITGHGDVICHDLPTGRYFKSNMEKLRSVQNDINAQVNEVGMATLSDLYVALGLRETPFSEEIGWTPSRLLDLHFSAVLTDDNQPCISIDYHADAIRSDARFPRGCDEDPPF